MRQAISEFAAKFRLKYMTTKKFHCENKLVYGNSGTWFTLSAIFCMPSSAGRSFMNSPVLVGSIFHFPSLQLAHR